MEAKLELLDLRLWTQLGCTKGERKQAQEVSVSFEILFDEIPPACTTDELQDTFCYGAMSTALKNLCVSSEFHTIEKLGRRSLEEIRKIVGPKNSITLRLHKLKPPVEGLVGGVVFHLKDVP